MSSSPTLPGLLGGGSCTAGLLDGGSCTAGLLGRGSCTAGLLEGNCTAGLLGGGSSTAGEQGLDSSTYRVALNALVSMVERSLVSSRVSGISCRIGAISSGSGI